MVTEISVLIAIIGCFVGLAGWLTRRDTKIADDAEWKGKVDTTLAHIDNGVVGINDRMAKMEGKLEEHDKQLAIHETQITEIQQKIKERKETR
jgi:peptidoglycan hydrolase CwlO-like protein